MNKNIVRLLLGCAVVLLFLGHAARFWQMPFVSALDAYLYDARVRLSAPNTVDDRIVVVDLDEKSLAEIGRWPWNRQTVAEMVRRLADDYGAVVIGFDVVFAEPDESSGLPVLERIARGDLRGDKSFHSALRGLRGSLNYDRIFAETLKDRPVVLGYTFTDFDGGSHGTTLPAPVFSTGEFDARELVFPRWKGFTGNLIELQQHAASGGHFNPQVDFDGVSRRVPLLLEYRGAYYEALSLAMVRQMLGAKLHPGYPDDSSGMEWLDVVTPRGSLSIPVDEQAAALIPYRGGERSFPYVSAADVIKGRADMETLWGKIILVGTTAAGLKDLRSTPVGAVYPGVEVHANLIAGMLDGTIRQKPSWVVGVETLMIVIFGGLLAFLLPRLSPMQSSLATFLGLGLMLGINYGLWEYAALVLPLAAGMLTILLLYGFNMSWGYFVESRTKRQFAELFGQYVPPELVDEMAKDPESYSMEGRNQELTVLFSDVRSFTTISEGLDPKELTQLMNEYLGAMTTVIRRNRGTLDKYIGDAIMAFWGAPVGDPEHARHAVLTALEMQAEVAKLAAPFRERGWPELHIGVGVNTGMMTVGDMGSTVRKAYTVMGDAVNLGARLEGITKQYGVGIIVGEVTMASLPDIAFRELDCVRVKGKDKPVGIYEPLGIAETLPEAVRGRLARWHDALRLYRAQDWDGAASILHELLRDDPDSYLYRLYRERIEQMRQEPPGDDWDGVTTFQTK